MGPKPVGYTEPEGWPIYRGTAGYGDVVLEYPEYGWNEFRPKSELTDEMHESAIGKPVTNGHPPTLLDQDTARHHTRGAIRRSWTEGDRHRIEFHVSDRDLIGDIESGKADLSLGYKQRDPPDESPGEHKGKRYRFVQRDLRINHLSVEDEARAQKNGKPAGITMDGKPKGAPMLTDDTNDDKQTEQVDAAGEQPDGARMDALSEAGKKALASMPEADRKMVESALKDMYDEEAGGEEAEMEDGADKMDMDMKDRLDRMEAKFDAMMKAMAGDAGRKDESGEPEKKDTGARKDAAPAAIDFEAVMAKAEERAREAAAQATVATTARLDAVKRICEPVGCYEPGDVLTSQVAYVKRMTPALGARMDSAVKDKDVATIGVLFEAAQETVKFNADTLDSHAAGLGARLDARSKNTPAADDTPVKVDLPAGNY